MTTKPANAASFFNSDMAQGYDKRNSALSPISDCLHFLTRLTLSDVPLRSRVLCVGVGTGADIFALSNDRPDLRFVGIDPSADMLRVARHRLQSADMFERCQLLEGYVEDVKERAFDVVVSLLVAHFIQAPDRPAFYRAVFERLKPGGRFVSAEISGDLDSPEFPALLDDWKQVQALMGATPESLASLENMLRGTLGVIAPDATEALWRDAGFAVPVPFFQAFMIRGWHARKPGG